MEHPVSTRHPREGRSSAPRTCVFFRRGNRTLPKTGTQIPDQMTESRHAKWPAVGRLIATTGTRRDRWDCWSSGLRLPGIATGDSVTRAVESARRCDVVKDGPRGATTMCVGGLRQTNRPCGGLTPPSAAPAVPQLLPPLLAVARRTVRGGVWQRFDRFFDRTHGCFALSQSMLRLG